MCLCDWRPSVVFQCQLTVASLGLWKGLVGGFSLALRKGMSFFLTWCLMELIAVSPRGCLEHLLVVPVITTIRPFGQVLQTHWDDWYLRFAPSGKVCWTQQFVLDCEDQEAVRDPVSL